MALVNVQKIREDLEKYDVTQVQVGESCGKSKSWLGNILSEGTTTAENIRMIERALFKAPGTYELTGAPYPPQNKNTRETLGAVESQMAEILQTLKVIRAWQEELLSELRSWRKTNTDQTGNIINKGNEVMTQILKCRSAIERKGEKE